MHKVKIDVNRLSEDWLVGNSLIAFVGALIVAQAWDQAAGAYELPFLNAAIPALPQVAILGITGFLVSLAFAFAAGAIAPAPSYP